MRHALLIALALAACSKKQDDGKPGGTPASPTGPAPTKPMPKEMSVKGSLALTGAVNATVQWKPDLALTCGCIEPGKWSVELTMGDGADTFTAMTLSTYKGLIFSSGKISGSMQSETKPTGSCALDRWNTDGVIAIDVDGTVKGTSGEVTIKGHLDVVCRPGA